MAASSQQDAHEAFCLLMDGCNSVDWDMLLALPLPAEVFAVLRRNNDTNADRYSTPLWAALGGLQESTITCHACQRSSKRYDIWHSLSLAVPEDPCYIEALVSDYFSTTSLFDACEPCKASNRRDKSDMLIRWPPVLIVHLKRWEVVSYVPFTRRKVDTEVSYETLLPVEPQLSYHLLGVVEHHGVADGGHYTSIVRTPDNQWYRCDDESSPQAVTPELALKAQAMILVYERI